MMKQEFENLIKGTVTEEEYEAIEAVYTWHPAVEDKKDIVHLYDFFGMVVIYDMYPRAKAIEEQDTHVRCAKARYEEELKKAEQLRGGKWA